MSYTIRATGLTKSFGPTPVLDGLDLLVPTGSVFALLGPNGAGKTTTVRILATLLRADGGHATVAGFDVATQAHQVRTAISLTGQEAAVDRILTARENLRMMARLRHLDRRAARERTEELLDRFDLRDAADRRVGTFSGGMRRRLDLAVGLVTDPPVVFLDEPTTGLDPRSRRDVWAAVAALRDAGTTVLLTTQYLDEADALADRVAVIDGGRVVAEGTPGELKARVGGETIALHVRDEGALRAAARVVDGVVSSGELTLRVPTDGTADAVRRLLDDLAARAVPVERITVHRSTLDEAFLALTSPGATSTGTTSTGAVR